MEEDDLKGELTCPICMDVYTEPRRLPCGHVYCRVCLQDMLTRKYLNTRCGERILSCPECRQRYDLTFQDRGVDVFPRDFKLVRLVDLFNKKFSAPAGGGGGDGGGGASEAGAGADNQTALKTVSSREGNSDSQTTSLSTTATTTTTTTTTTSPAATTTTTTVHHHHHHHQHHNAPQQQLHLDSDLHSFGSPALSLSDDSWLYVAGAGNIRQEHPDPPPASSLTRRQASGTDDSWLLPSSRDREGVSGESLDVRGSASVDYRTVAGLNPIVTVSARYDNNRENFQRYPIAEGGTTGLTHPPRPLTSPSSESSSSSESSDERGEEGSEEGSEEEEDDDGGHNPNRRSRLSRFFRSLVLSDSDSYDEDPSPDLHPRPARYQGLPELDVVQQGELGPGRARLPPHFHQGPPPPPPEFGLPHGELGAQRTPHFQGRPEFDLSSHGVSLSPAVGLDEAVRMERLEFATPGAREATPSSSLCCQAADPSVASAADSLTELKEAAGGRGGGEGESSRRGDKAACDTNHNSVVRAGVELDEGERGRRSSVGDTAAATDIVVRASSSSGAAVGLGSDGQPAERTGGGVSGVGVSGGGGGGGGCGAAPDGRAGWGGGGGGRGGGRVVEASDDSDSDYQPQTSMLRPKRKPRSRLKKFFTSLLSLSSSDDDDDDEDLAPVPTPPAQSGSGSATIHRT